MEGVNLLQLTAVVRVLEIEAKVEQLESAVEKVVDSASIILTKMLAPIKSTVFFRSEGVNRAFMYLQDTW